MSFILPYGGWGFLRGEEYFEIGISGCGVTETVVVGSKGGGVCSEGGGVFRVWTWKENVREKDNVEDEEEKEEDKA